ncbi:TetR/AcrR family transcriptional regulator [Kocuria sp. JC486]|uniref:TetR/AcrR family transcriptional regulator n=1 Tax=Kocuria soli TaxID=2485125 RepID=A0A3N3ZX67_9MICC|nr:MULTISPECIES: TetR/AcrR family transcriptional regulator [Kocuria]NHU86166.1 TetR/AcrR family transcriptional regulator [Kocuria sp. JC486]ROZ65702.1 TetR/AcrR family transcriptional regulator [Kocuria soli]
MPKIQAASNAEQREHTKRAILESFGRLLYSQGLTGLTMTHVAKNAGVGRTAVYNYFADMGELLVAYTLDETERFMTELRGDLEGVENPVDKLAIYIRAQIDDLSRRHLPPGPAMRSVLSPEDFAKLGEHVGALRGMLTTILQEAVDDGWLPAGDLEEMGRLVHSSLTATADREAVSEEAREAHERHVKATVLFALRGLGAQFDAEGNPVRSRIEPAALSVAV